MQYKWNSNCQGDNYNHIIFTMEKVQGVALLDRDYILIIFKATIRQFISLIMADCTSILQQRSKLELTSQLMSWTSQPLTQYEFLPKVCV